jgi:DNA repair protein RadC
MAQSRSVPPPDSPSHTSYPIREMPLRLRPREMMERLGADHVPEDVLLAIILRSGVKGSSVLDLARDLLRKYGTLSRLASTDVDSLASMRGMGRTKAQTIVASLQLAKRLASESVPDAPQIVRPEDVVKILKEQSRTLDKEVFWVLPLDAKNRMKSPPLEITSGILDASLVHPREVFAPAIRLGCAAVILAHNHPSGDPSPSAEDIRITRQIVEAGRIVDINVLDHVILGKPDDDASRAFTSLKESGLVKFK